ncbi:hypothetical protein EV188_104480 [Actinomycetospora succinea]|uniref:Uncharacterized protein n=1 Tax=Actinomycetospora succinea TaxID=663603 RepID=A0A4R6VAN1_9PSEU|nr:hypothetical protein [Actinomycetospora succinea]TDQ58733.1 hypothetical protein EV188_104480 [Actinomycetospora succinea]
MRNPWTRPRAVAAVLGLGLVVEATHQLRTRGPHTTDLPIVDNWLHSTLILASAGICLWGAFLRPAGGPARRAWFCFTTALLVFALADILWVVLYSGSGDVPTPNPTDPLYLATYPLFLAGLVFMVRARVTDVPWHRWLDGFVLVLVVATPGVLLVIVPVAATAPLDPLGQIITVAYPLGDILLFGGLLGTLPLISWRLVGSWPWVGLGLLCFTVADSAYSLTAADVVSHDGPYDFLWSAGALAFAVGACRPPAGRRPPREITGFPAIALPLGAQLVALATQVYGWYVPLPPVERLLTIGVLAVGIAQVIVSRPRPARTEFSVTETETENGEDTETETVTESVSEGAARPP